MFKRLFSRILLFVLFASVGSPSLAVQQTAQQPDLSELEKTILEELKETNTPGAAVAVVSGDRVIFAKGFGVSNIETGAPVAPDMLFRIGSTTKMYTTAALVALAEEGKLKLDEPIGNHVKGLSPRLAQTTAHQLMTHSAGIRDAAPSFGAHDESALATTVRSWKDDYFFTDPGKVMSYSNPGLTLAGFVVEEVGGRPFAKQVAERLFEPLGMTRTTFYPTVAMTYPLSQGHHSLGSAKPTIVRPFADNSGYWPAGFMFSSVTDLARFAIAFMNGGRIDGKQVMQPGVISKLATGYVEVPSRGAGAKYGYGLMLREHRGVRLVEHGGAIAGFGSTFIMAPDQRVAVIVLGNKTAQGLGKTAEKALELMLPLKPKDDAGRDMPLSESDMARFAGTYTQGGGPSAELLIKDGKLHIKQGPAQFPLTRIGEYRFSFMPPGAPRASEFALVPGADGRIEYLHSGARAMKKK
jgi:CubicO group peptidase (beta-lactamase class C family)